MSLDNLVESDAVHSTSEIRIGTTLVRESLEELTKAGFTIIPGPLLGESLAELIDAYDRVMSQASGPDFRAGSTINRMWDLLSFSRIFDEVFLHKPLLEACSQVIGEPFKLSSFLGRTLRASISHVRADSSAGPSTRRISSMPQL